MFNSFLVALQVVLPMALLMGVGCLIRTVGLVTRDDMAPIDRLIFKVFMPCMLFKNIYNTDLSSSFHAKEVIFTLVSLGLLFLIGVLLPPRLVKDRKQAASIGQAIFRSNFVLFGVAVTESIYGEGNAGLTALLGAIVIPTTNALSIVLLEMSRSRKAKPGQLLKAVLSNAMVISAILALGLMALDIRLPDMVYSVVEDLAGVTTTISFLSLGVSLNLKELRQNSRALTLGILLRMVIIPLVFLPITVALGFRGAALCAMIILFAAPTAISTYPMAVAMDADGPLAGQLVCTTTLLSVVTMFLLTFLFQSLGML